MRLSGAGSHHLTYCTNIHPGESWAEVRDNLVRYVLPVREHVAPGQPFGLGLRLSGLAARELGQDGRLQELRTFLHEHGLYVFTFNGFPHGAFHGQPVKEEVYRPDWLEEERLAYTNGLADLMAALLDKEIEGTISTVPGAFAPRVNDSEDAARMAACMARHVHHLLRLRDTTGHRIALALEPEPCCYMETTAETVEFFERHLFGPAGVETLMREAGLSHSAAEQALREHLGLCFDACHMAVEFEDAGAALASLHAAGIRLLKVQVSAGLQVELRGPEVEDRLRALERFADDVYLHQVVERQADGSLRRYLDLPQALAGARAAGTEAEWRVHFHVPLFLSRLGPFASTQSYVADALKQLQHASDCRHYEVETYTWDVLPDEYRAEGIVSAVAREMEWAAAQLTSASA